jgi:triosephosphate isomerase (TIM)
MKLIIGNWKMYPATQKEAKQIIDKLTSKFPNSTKVKVVVCPPAVFLSVVSQGKGKSKIFLGGQTCSTEDEGAHTGEISPKSLASLGLKYVLLGHSERREMGETNDTVAGKAIGAVRNNLSVAICVGEKERDSHGNHFTQVAQQLAQSLRGFPKDKAHLLVVAYEPIWAIGAKAKNPASPADHREMSILIRRTLTEYFGKSAAFAVPILYGGSVDEENATGYLTEGQADGLLVGRVSLHPNRFLSIIERAISLPRV